MQEIKINLEEILKSSYLKHKEVWGLTPIDNKYKNVAKDAMLEFGKQLLELAAQNAEVIRLNEFSTHFEINEQSIIDTIKLVE